MKTVWIVLASLVVSGVVVGSGTYYFLHNRNISEKKDLQSQINSLKVKTDNLLPPPQFQGMNNSYVASTDSWNVLNNSAVGYSFKYPSDIINNGTQTTIPDNSPIGTTIDLFPKSAENKQLDVTQKFFGLTCENKDKAESWVLGSGGELDSQEITLSSGLAANFGISLGGIPTYNYHVQNDKLACVMAKTMTDYSPFSKPEDDEAIGIINTFRFTK